MAGLYQSLSNNDGSIADPMRRSSGLPARAESRYPDSGIFPSAPTKPSAVWSVVATNRDRRRPKSPYGFWSVERNLLRFIRRRHLRQPVFSRKQLTRFWPKLPPAIERHVRLDRLTSVKLSFLSDCPRSPAPNDPGSHAAPRAPAACSDSHPSRPATLFRSPLRTCAVMYDNRRTYRHFAQATRCPQGHPSAASGSPSK